MVQGTLLLLQTLKKMIIMAGTNCDNPYVTISIVNIGIASQGFLTPSIPFVNSSSERLVVLRWSAHMTTTLSARS